MPLPLDFQEPTVNALGGPETTGNVGPTRLPLGNVSTGRATDLPGASGGTSLIELAKKDIRERLESTGFKRLMFGTSVPAAAEMAIKLEAVKRADAQASATMLKDLADILIRGNTQKLAAFNGITDKIPSIATRLLDASEDEKETILKGLDAFADEQGVGGLKPLIRRIATQTDLGTRFPQYRRYLTGPHAPMLAFLLPTLMKEGKEHAAMWDVMAPNIAREIDAKARKIFRVIPAATKMSFDEVVDLLADDDPAADFLHGRIPIASEAVAKVRRGVLNRLVVAGVTLPETVAAALEAKAKAEGTALGQTTPDVVAGKAIEAETVAAARERARTSPQAIAGEVARAGAVTRATESAKLAPEIVEMEARRLKATTAAVEETKARFDIIKPLGANEASTMRSQFLVQSKDFADTIRAYQRVEDSAKAPSAAGDLAMIFNYMKMLDPGSVVREGEQASAASARGVPDAVRSMYNRLLSGERLAPGQRDDFLNRSRMLVRGQLGQHEQVEGEFKRIASKRKGDPGEVVPDLVGSLRQTIKSAKIEGAKAEPLSRKSADYRKARARGLSDVQIESRYNITLTD